MVSLLSHFQSCKDGSSPTRNFFLSTLTTNPNRVQILWLQTFFSILQLQISSSNPNRGLIMFWSLVPAPRVYAISKALFVRRMCSYSFLVLNSLAPPIFRGKLSFNEVVAFVLDNATKEKRSDGGKILPDLEYYPFESVVDELGIVIFARW